MKLTSKLWKRVFSCVCIAFLVTGIFVGNAAQITVHAASGNVDNSVADGVVAILTVKEVNGGLYGSRGSGFFVGQSGKDPQYIVTNCHVIDDALHDSDYMVLIAFSQDEWVQAQIVAYGDMEYVDLAVLKLESPTDKRHPLKLMELDQSTMRTMDVWAVGFPGNADNEFSDASQFGTDDVTFAPGQIKRFVKNEGKQVERISVSCPIQHGHSGGPLVSEEGYVVGVNCNVWSESPYEGQVEADYYAINTSELINFLDKNDIPYEAVADDGSSGSQENSGENSGAEDPNSVPAVSSSTQGNGGSMMAVVIILAFVMVIVIVLIVVIVLVAGKKKSSAQIGSAASGGASPARKSRGPVARSLAAQHNGLSVSISQKPIMVGRDRASCAIVYVEGTAGVSGKHCTIAFDLSAQAFIVTDVGSSYGTFLMNGQRLQPNVPCRLKVGDSFYVGDRANVIRLELG